MRKPLIALTLAVAAATPLAAASAQYYNGYDRYDRYNGGYDRYDRYHRDNGYNGYYGTRYYDNSYHRYYQERRLSRNDRIWRGRDGRYYCHRSDGTTGLIVGAALGGVLGNSVAGYHDRTLGTILGMAGGGLLGSQIDRGEVRCH